MMAFGLVWIFKEQQQLDDMYTRYPGSMENL